MLISKYKDAGFLFNVNLTGKLGDDEVYRGDLVLEFGEVTERGDRKPPSIVAKQCVLFSAEDRIKLILGGLDKLSDIEMIQAHYQEDYAEECEILFFVHDIKDPMIIAMENKDYIVVPLDDGMIWNEALELLCIEKSDLKGQSAEQKVATLYDELKSFNAAYEKVGYEEALTRTFEVKAEARGPV